MNKLSIAAASLGLAATTLIVACSGPGGSSTPATSQASGRTAAPASRHFKVPQGSSTASGTRKKMDASGNLVDGGFESGGTTYWGQCGNVNARVATYRPHTGSYSDLNGYVSAPEVNGDSGLCQQVTIPTGGKLTFWVYEGTNETSTTYAWQEADLLDSTGAVVQTLYLEAVTTNGWVQRTYDVSSHAGQSLWIYFGVHGDGYASGNVYSYVDDVAWVTGSSTPTPAPTATPTPGVTPTPVPSATPTPVHTATPTPVPTATPTPVSGATPFPTPAGSGPHGTTCGTSCGVQRWHIKTLDDGDEHLINWTPQSASVSQLAAIPVPAGYDQYNDTTRYAPTETQAYTVRAVLVGWKSETDHDFHIVIADPNNPNSTMIVEPPDSACSAACDSGFGSTFDAVRTKLTNCFGPVPSSFTNFPSGIVVDLTGVPLFDALHGQTGVAPNGIELHPLLDFQWVSGKPAGC